MIHLHKAGNGEFKDWTRKAHDTTYWCSYQSFVLSFFFYVMTYFYKRQYFLAIFGSRILIKKE